MATVKVRDKIISYDLAVDVPYDKSGEEEVTFFFRWVPYMRPTETAPEEGGHWETIHIEGFHYDDDLPDLEDYAMARASEIVSEAGLSFR